ncbi:MAG: DEAD/DEAH box helicase [Calditrichaeota bacterium]|nr:DEAD/DEAH box helicase [Calditrichota bacterium]
MGKLPQKIKNTIPSAIAKAAQRIVQEEQYAYFDFVRNSYTAKITDRGRQYWPVVVIQTDRSALKTECSCNAWLQYTICQHTTALLHLIYCGDSSSVREGACYALYEKSLWCSLAKIGFEFYGVDKLSIATEKKGKEFVVSGADADGELVFRFKIFFKKAGRLVQKYRWQFFKQFSEEELPDDSALESLDIIEGEKTAIEIRMNENGFMSWQQKFEESFWFDFSKYWFLNYANLPFHVDFSSETGQLNIRIDNDFQFVMKKNQVPQILQKLMQNETIAAELKIHAAKAILNYALRVTDDADLKIIPVLQLPDKAEPIYLTTEAKIEIVLFGRFLFLPGEGFYPFKRTIDYFDAEYFGLQEKVLPNEEIVQFLREYKRFIDADKFIEVSPSLRQQEIETKIKQVDVFVDEMKDDWLYLSVKYRVGQDTISLYDLYQALRSGKRYFISKNHWVDLKNQEFKWLTHFLEERADNAEVYFDKNGNNLKINKMGFIKLNAHLPLRSKVGSRRGLKSIVDNLSQFQPLTDVPDLSKCRYKLRPYQLNGFRWLWFIYENQLSGLLCDDMGLGKTYQSLALLDGVMIAAKKKMNFLVVCPTSVIPHWQEKLGELKKKVNLILYYGSNRQLDSLKKFKYNVVLTSYGVMRNDLQELSQINLEVAIFDEIQIAKNKASLTNAAINQLTAKMRLGLTGTPIENSLSELKALFDIVLPSYLGGDFSFRKQYVYPIERGGNKERVERLYKMIRPFMLRRTKGQVLSELPPKIEEVRRCELSRDQLKMYEEVIKLKASSLVSKLAKADSPVPYIHIFAVLNYLKQICNHPAQLDDKKALDYQKYQSGKWDLFCELLDESLNSGFKVVVFSQYLNMIALIEQYLQEQNIGFATIKGATVNRKKMIDCFNKDPECRVFVGSLRAAGKGINLIGGSVVIHYDRWWNAAVEDQATDRVHRIGQTRGVQVFKLITEGTLEEKIDRIIRKKKQLMNDLVRADDANLVKQFTRNDLIDLLSFDKIE